MNCKAIFILALSFNAGCVGYTSSDGQSSIIAAEQAGGDMNALADRLIPMTSEVCAKSKVNWDYYWSCQTHSEVTGLALYLAGRYPEAKEHLALYLEMTKVSNKQNPDKFKFDEIACDVDISFKSESKIDALGFYNARTALYKSLKEAGDPRAKDYLALAYLCQGSDSVGQWPPIMSDSDYLADIQKFWGNDDRDEAEFYINNIKKVLISKQDQIKYDPANTDKYEAEMTVLYKNAFDYSVKNSMSVPYQQYLEQQYKNYSKRHAI